MTKFDLDDEFADHRRYRPSDQGATLLQRTLELITLHPEVHNQRVWADVARDRPEGPIELDPSQPTACGTVGCLAGNAVLLANVHPVRLRRSHGASYLEVYFHDRWEDLDYWTQGVAVNLLDLSEEQADYLFDEERTLVDMWAYAEWITDDRVSRTKLSQPTTV